MLLQGIWLICVDGSENSNVAFEETLRHAAPENDQLILLNVVQSGVLPSAPKKEKANEDKAENRFARFVSQAKDKGFKHVRLAVESAADPKQEICKQAKFQSADYVVVGARGHSTVSKIVLGSVAKHCLEASPCPVFVVRQREFTKQMNVLIFGPNGSGKGLQGSVVQREFGICHIESGVIFRNQIAAKTELGMKAKMYMDKGELVPDEITIPMILNRLKQVDCNHGFLLDGFPRTRPQAEALWNALQKEGINLDFVVEIVLDRPIVRKRILGRRVCGKDGNHPNNVSVEALNPLMKADGLYCRVCGSQCSQRTDDIDEKAVDKRHDIYYSSTMEAVGFLKTRAKHIQIDGRPSPVDVTADLRRQLKL